MFRYLLVLTLLLGCATETSRRAVIVVVTNGFEPDMELLNDKYEALMDCIGADPDAYLDTFVVEVVRPGHTGFPCSADTSKVCDGEYINIPGAEVIRVTESLHGLAHELGHHMDYMLYGRQCVVTAARENRHIGSLATTCGDIVDGVKVVRTFPAD